MIRGDFLDVALDGVDSITPRVENSVDSKRELGHGENFQPRPSSSEERIRALQARLAKLEKLNDYLKALKRDGIFSEHVLSSETSETGHGHDSKTRESASIRQADVESSVSDHRHVMVGNDFTIAPHYEAQNARTDRGENCHEENFNPKPAFEDLASRKASAFSKEDFLCSPNAGSGEESLNMDRRASWGLMLRNTESLNVNSRNAARYAALLPSLKKQSGTEMTFRLSCWLLLSLRLWALMLVSQRIPIGLRPPHLQKVNLGALRNGREPGGACCASAVCASFGHDGAAHAGGGYGANCSPLLRRILAAEPGHLPALHLLPKTISTPTLVEAVIVFGLWRAGAHGLLQHAPQPALGGILHAGRVRAAAGSTKGDEGQGGVKNWERGSQGSVTARRDWVKNELRRSRDEGAQDRTAIGGGWREPCGRWQSDWAG